MSALTNILVTGSSGQLGGLVVNELLNLRSSHPGINIIAASRTTAKLEAFQKRGAELRQLDLLDRASAEKAFAGVHRVILISTDTIGARAKAHTIAIESAVKAGVKHVLYTSCPNPLSDRPLVNEHFETEVTLASSKLGYTLLRNNLYFETLFHSLPGAIARGGVWANANGNGRRALVSRVDLALAAANAALNFSGTGSDLHRTYDLGGPELVDNATILAELREATGKEVKDVQITDQQLVDAIAGFLPRPLAESVAYLDVHTREGFLGSKTQDLEKLIGRKPKTLKEFFAEHKEAFLNPSTH